MSIRCLSLDIDGNEGLGLDAWYCPRSAHLFFVLSAACGELAQSVLTRNYVSPVPEEIQLSPDSVELYQTQRKLSALSRPAQQRRKS